MMVLRQLRLPRRCVCGKCDGMRATSRDGPASPVATSFGIKMFSQLKLRTKGPCISNVLLQIYLQLQIYLACNDSLYPPSYGRRWTCGVRMYSPLLCCWFTEQRRSWTCEGYGLLPNCVLWESMGRALKFSAAVFSGCAPFGLSR